MKGLAVGIVFFLSVFGMEKKIDEDTIPNLVAKMLTNIYDEAEKNLKLPDEECMVCYEQFPVSFQFSCGHEVCAICAESIMNKCVTQNCPKCRSPFPQRMLEEWLMLLKIYPIALTPDISIQKLQRAFPLICSVANLATVTKCVKMGVNVDIVGFGRYFPLHLVSQTNVVKYLLYKGANVNQVTIDGETPLYISCQRGFLPVTEYLIRNRANVNQTTTNGVTPLLYSSQHGHLQVVEYLIEYGAKVNQADNNGWTPLLWSSQEGYLAIVEYLINNGADVNQVNKNSTTPLCIASSNAHLSC